MIVGLAFIVGVVLGGLVVCYLMARAERDTRRAEVIDLTGMRRR